MTLLSTSALAHKSSDSYLKLFIAGQSIDGQWDIALRDLEQAIGIDQNGDGKITWGELKAEHARIAKYAMERLTLSVNGSVCSSHVEEQMVDRHNDGAYAVLRFATKCPFDIETLEITYRLLFDIDPSHRGLLRLERGNMTQVAVLGPDQPTRKLDLARAKPLEQAIAFGSEGVWHIWTGYDHILFLLCLLLPAVLSRKGARWQVTERLGQVLWQVLTIVTAFTLAHSLTLSLAVFGVVDLPSRLVESGIAASIVLAAINNIFPMVTKHIWTVAFGFGLLHGLGFASALRSLLLSDVSLVTALVGFNLGVEAGQAVIVGILLPLAFAARRTWFYQRLVMQGGSLVCGVLAAFWFFQRAFGPG